MSRSANEPNDTAGSDVTDREFQRSLLNAINDASPDGILAVDGEGLIVSHNQRFVDMWKIPARRLTGTRAGSAVGASDERLLEVMVERVKDRDAFLARVKELYASRHLDDHSEIELVDGRTMERHSTVLRGQQDQYLGRVWFFRDITARKQTEIALQALARHDPLTGIMNRRYFAERANQEFVRARRYQLAVVIATFDIDHFKRINDTYGHATGDAVLKAVCDASKSIMRETNLFARIGGEEFAVLLSDCNIDGAKIFTQRLRGAIATARIQAGAEEIVCTVSVGLALRRPDEVTADACLERADRAMYRAKENGRNRVEALEE